MHFQKTLQIKEIVIMFCVSVHMILINKIR